MSKFKLNGDGFVVSSDTNRRLSLEDIRSLSVDDRKEYDLLINASLKDFAGEDPAKAFSY